MLFSVGRNIAMTIARYIVGLALLLFATYVAVMNWACIIVSVRNSRRGIDRHHSTIPFVSFFVVILAMAVYPGRDQVWMLAVPLLDIGHWILIVSVLLLPFWMIRESRKTGAEPGAGASTNAGPDKPPGGSENGSG